MIRHRAIKLLSLDLRSHSPVEECSKVPRSHSERTNFGIVVLEVGLEGRTLHLEHLVGEEEVERESEDAAHGRFEMSPKSDLIETTFFVHLAVVCEEKECRDLQLGGGKIVFVESEIGPCEISSVRTTMGGNARNLKHGEVSKVGAEMRNLRRLRSGEPVIEDLVSLILRDSLLSPSRRLRDVTLQRSSGFVSFPSRFQESDSFVDTEDVLLNRRVEVFGVATSVFERGENLLRGEDEFSSSSTNREGERRAFDLLETE